MEPAKILILEDERTVALRVQRLVQKILNEDIRFWLLETLDQARNIIALEAIDLLFLDLDLNGRDGIELIAQMGANRFHCIIISAHEHKAIEAFEHGVLDFIGKPFTEARLTKALNRWKDKTSRPEVPARYLSIKKKGALFLVALSDIDYIQGAGPYAEIYLKNGSKHLHSKSLDGLLQLLPVCYERIHKSYIVDIGHIDRISIKKGGRYVALLLTGQEIPVGRTRYKELVQRLCID